MKYLSYEEFEKANVFGKGNLNEAFAQYFIGDSFLQPLTSPNETAVFLANVTFEPGCRNNWHIHHAKKGRRAASYLYCRRGLVSGERKSGCQLEAGYGDYHTARSEVLARCEKGQLVFTHCRGSAWRKDFQRMVRGCNG